MAVILPSSVDGRAIAMAAAEDGRRARRGRCRAGAWRRRDRRMPVCEHDVVAGALAFVAQAAGDDPGQRVEPEHGAQTRRRRAAPPSRSAARARARGPARRGARSSSQPSASGGRTMRGRAGAPGAHRRIVEQQRDRAPHAELGRDDVPQRPEPAVRRRTGAARAGRRGAGRSGPATSRAGTTPRRRSATTSVSHAPGRCRRHARPAAAPAASTGAPLTAPPREPGRRRRLRAPQPATLRPRPARCHLPRRHQASQRDGSEHGRDDARRQDEVPQRGRAAAARERGRQRHRQRHRSTQDERSPTLITSPPCAPTCTHRVDAIEILVGERARRRGPAAPSRRPPPTRRRTSPPDGAAPPCGRRAGRRSGR